jgi:hypothetical protein
MSIIDELCRTANRQNIRNAKLVEETDKSFKIAIQLLVRKRYATIIESIR